MDYRLPKHYPHQVIKRCWTHIGQAGERPWGNPPVTFHPPEYCNYGGTINVALDLPGRLGFKDIAVIGCDLGIRKPVGFEKDPNHFDDGYQTYIPDWWRWDQVDDTLRYVHQMAKKHYREQGGRVVNAGIGGELEIHPRVDLRDWVAS